MGDTSEPTYGVEVIARLLNLTPRRVQQLAKEGVIPKAARGKYALAPSVIGYVRYLQEKVENPGSETQISLNAERARKTKAEADIAEMEASKMRGDLVDADDMKSTLDLIMSEVKTKLLNNVPTRVAARIKAEKKEAVIKLAVKEEIADALKILSGLDPAALVEGE